MSNDLKTKLYNYEVPPPEANWEKLALMLNSELSPVVAQSLYDAEAVPPPGSWTKISAGLEESSDNQRTGKLYAMAIDPPDDAWQKIALSLDQEKILASSPRKIVPLLKYAVAACLVGALAIGALKLLTRHANQHSLADKTNPPQKPTPGSKADSLQAVDQSQALDKVPQETEPMAAVAGGAMKKNPPPVYVTEMTNAGAGNDNTGSLPDFHQASLTGEIPGNCSVVSEADRYLSFINSDGYLIRISKKLAETLGCIYTKSSSDEYKGCETQIDKWRDRIAQSSAGSSPDNFLDVIDIICSVQD